MTNLSAHAVLTFGCIDRKRTNGFLGIRRLPLPTWEALSQIGQMPLLRGLWIWAIVVPICARAIAAIPESVSFPLFDQTLNLKLHLPFTWQILYFANLSVAFGNIIYACRCPKIIQTFPSWDDLGNRISSPMEAASYAAEVLRTRHFWLSQTESIPVAEVMETFWEFYGGPDRVYTNDESQLLHATAGIERVRIIAEDENARTDLLGRIRVFANVSRFWSRLACGLFYFAGFLFLSSVLWSNLCFVFESI